MCCGVWMQHLADLCDETCWWMSMGFLFSIFILMKRIVRNKQNGKEYRYNESYI
ncbi:hypothetical protein CBFG_03031 [Clostridiales bacterium 1_7_47FAA]|nr:hypothetical protein CBFG_03031 [Clostridiales bacterium 1_7_47FAA]